ncbi:hypothetical protein DC915_RS03040 [Vibrio parahaemolyticus]|nr:hypothetical protein [Vibrio parahaemolyticus]EJG0009955.1 hypothetical protein [Vibrio parahaemolyticus]
MSNKPKFLNIFYIKTGVQVRIGTKSRAFAYSKYANAVKSALQWRNECYKSGVLPNGCQVEIIERDAFSLVEQPNYARTRCNIRTRIDRKVTHVDIYWSVETDSYERSKKLKKRFEDWRQDHNLIASLYNEARKKELLIMAEREEETFTPLLVDKLKFNADLWNKCVDEVDGVKPMVTTITPHKAIKFDDDDADDADDAIDLSHMFTLDFKSASEELNIKLDSQKKLPKLKLVSLHRKPKVLRSEDKLRENLINFPEVNTNLRGKVFLPFVIETEKRSSYLRLAVDEELHGLPINPCRLNFDLTNYDELTHALKFLYRSNYIFRGYIQKHELLSDKPNHKLAWDAPSDSMGEPMLAVNSVLDSLLLQLGRKSFNSTGKCLERLAIWHKHEICHLITDDQFFYVNAGQWSFVCPRNTSKQMQHLCLAIMAAKVESNLEKEVKNRILLKENVGQANLNDLKRRYNHVSSEQLDRFKALQNRIHHNRFKFYPLVDTRALKTPKPDQVYLSRCKHCGSVPTARFKGNSQTYFAQIFCPNKCEQPIIEEGQHEREMHLAVINWEKRNIERMNLSNIYMWNLKLHSKNQTLGAYLHEVRSFLSDNVEYNKLTRILPREVVKDKAGKGFARNVEINLMYAELFLEAFDLMFMRQHETPQHNVQYK